MKTRLILAFLAIFLASCAPAAAVPTGTPIPAIIAPAPTIPIYDATALPTFTPVSTALPVLLVDKYGDGTDVTELRPSSVVIGNGNPDLQPPVTIIQITGTLQNGVYTSNVTVTLSAMDNQSGVLNTVYSLDGGQTILPYNDPFQISTSGAWIIQAGSTDQVGNSEWPYQSVSIELNLPPTPSTSP